MFLFDHGQPALLYVVPACMGCSLLVALLRGDWALLPAYDEETAHSALKAAAHLQKKEAMEKKTE
jgi:hypothetical protein